MSSPTHDLPKRLSIRFRDYDYSAAGAYFVTTNTSQRWLLLGNIEGGMMIQNQLGKIVNDCWEKLPAHYPNVKLDSFVIMPDHVHGIIFLEDSAGGSETRPYGANIMERRSLSEIIRAFKSFSSRRINELRRTMGISVWQRNYYEHVIRNEAELLQIREYIINNPVSWSPGKIDTGDDWLNQMQG